MACSGAYIGAPCILNGNFNSVLQSIVGVTVACLRLRLANIRQPDYSSVTLQADFFVLFLFTVHVANS